MGRHLKKYRGSYHKGLYETGNGVLLTTGASKRNSVLNIYDFAGNLNEFSLMFWVENEVVQSVLRGGSFSKNGMAWTPFVGGTMSYGACSVENGFRITLIPSSN